VDQLENSYWSKVLTRRLSRRRAIAGTGAFGAAAAFLAACGGGDSGGSSGPRDSSGLLSEVKDETASAKRGGTYVDSHPGVILTHDPMKTGIAIRVARRGYSQLFRIKPGILQPTDGSIEGDLAESWELSEDKLTLTVKLDPGAGLPPIAPVNGRQIDADDVLFSWERLQTEGIGRTELSNQINSGAPIVSMSAPDKRTVVIKMAEPNATIFSLLGTEVLGSLYIIPREGGEGGFDIARQAIGSGPYYMTDSSEVALHWKRNPNFKRASLKNGEPFIEEIHEPVIPDISQATAQFRAGAIYEYNVQAVDILSTKRDLPQLMMRTTDPNITGTERLYFGQNDDSPFRDERVRIAYMKTIDRDDFIAAAHNTDRFEEEGLPVTTYWEAGLGAGSWGGWFLDPRDKSFGENAKNYVYDLAEAKKLIEAAGFSTPLEFTESYAAPGPSSFPASFFTRADIFLGQVEGSGVFRMNRNLINYQTEWNSERYRFSKGRFTGATWGPDTASPDATLAVFFLFNSAGGYFQGGDATLDDLTNRARREFDDQKRMDLVHEVQRQHGSKFFNNKIGTASSFALNWPVVRNLGVFRGGTNWLDTTTPGNLRAWLDETKPPLGNA
jgi:ABC-type transport system substrate-binding protein